MLCAPGVRSRLSMDCHELRLHVGMDREENQPACNNENAQRPSSNQEEARDGGGGGGRMARPSRAGHQQSQVERTKGVMRTPPGTSTGSQEAEPATHETKTRHP